MVNFYSALNHFIHNKMKSLTAVLILALLSSSLAQVNILWSSNITVLTSPAGQFTIDSSAFNTSPGAILGTGVGWIQSSIAGPGTKVFENNFYASCTGAATLYITAYASFSAYLDGVLIGSGSNMNQVYKFPVKLTCGSHTFKVVISANQKTPALIFVIKQDQSNCFNCQVTGFWNEQVCKCQCINPKPTLPACLCKSPKVWRGYPFCGCGCPNIYTLANVEIASAASAAVRDPTAAVGAVAGGDEDDEDQSAGVNASAADKIAAFAPLCLKPKYYNLNTCKCVCHYKYCGPKEYFDENTCSCWPYIY